MVLPEAWSSGRAALLAFASVFWMLVVLPALGLEEAPSHDTGIDLELPSDEACPWTSSGLDADGCGVSLRQLRGDMTSKAANAVEVEAHVHEHDSWGPILSDADVCKQGIVTALFKGPQYSGMKTEAWRRAMHQWREDTARKAKLTSAVYSNEALSWTRTSYVQPQVHLWDRYLYNETKHEFTVQRYLDDLRARYGGIDSVLLWPTYPNIGVDARNQWDLWRATPGGLPALTEVTRQFHAAGVRVLWGYNPFDQGLRQEGEPHWTTLARLLKVTGGDGFNGDTMVTIPKEFYDAGLAIDHPIVGEPEMGGYPHCSGTEEETTWISANWVTTGWGYYSYGSAKDGMTRLYWFEPGVDRAKWLDASGRRQTHVNDRWTKERHDAMQFAHFNGVGYESWENVWGVWMQLTPRDGEALRRNQKVWRWLGESEFTQGYEEWEPYSADLWGLGLYTSRWKHVNGTCAWTVVNRDKEPRSFNLTVDKKACQGGRLFDLYGGREVEASGMSIEALGYAAFVFTSSDWAPPGLEALLAEMRELAKRPLGAFDASWSPLPQRMQSPGHSPAGPRDAPPEGSVLVPRTRYHFQTGGVEIEGGCDATKDTAGTGNCCGDSFTGKCPSKDPYCKSMCAFPGADDRGVDIQFPWEPSPRRFHDVVLDMGPFYIDRFPVTNAQFKVYLDSTGYRPRDPYNFLKDWMNSTHYRAGHGRKPVTWVTLSEARSYCAWAGKRLPHTYEWQLAAQGTDGRSYPWGDELQASRYPTPGYGHEVPELPDVGSFPEGDSPFKMSDVVGTVWQFTDVFEDEHTRAVVVKGSSNYNPMIGSKFPATRQYGNWYFPVARKVTQHNRLLLMDDSYDRAGTVGFRCAADHPDGAAGPHHLHSWTVEGDEQS